MTWKGYENWTPPTKAGPSTSTTPTKKRPRVKNATRCWVTVQGAILKTPGNVPDLLSFDSMREARHWLVLREMARVGEISHLRRQVPYPLNVVRPDGHPETIARWVADFVYTERAVSVAEDAKGYKTDIYKRNRKHFAAQYGFAIRET